MNDLIEFGEWLDANTPKEDKELSKALFEGPFAKPRGQTLGDSMNILSSGE